MTDQVYRGAFNKILDKIYSRSPQYGTDCGMKLLKQTTDMRSYDDLPIDSEAPPAEPKRPDLDGYCSEKRQKNYRVYINRAHKMRRKATSGLFILRSRQGMR